MTIETPQPTCPICLRSEDDCLADDTYTVCYRLGYEREKAAKEEALARLDKSIVGNHELAKRYEAAESAREAIERAAKELRDDLVLAREARAEERRRALVDARDAVRKAVEPGPYQYTAVLAIESIASAPASLPSPGARPLTYLACPYSHPDRAVRVARFEAATHAAGALMADGQKVFSPISHTHPIAEAHDLPLGWDFWEAFDRAFLSISGHVVVLRVDGWEQSKGIAGELRIAAEMGLPVEYIDPAPLPSPEPDLVEALEGVRADLMAKGLKIDVGAALKSLSDNETPPEQDASHVEAGASRGGTSIRIHRASRGSGTSMNDDPKGLMAEQRERLGPVCTHFRYASRCEECGASPMKAQTDPPPDKDPEG